MLVKNIIKKVCFFIEENGLEDELDDLANMSEASTALLNKLVRCFNLVRNEIAGEYIKELQKEQVKVTEGQISFSSLSHEVLDIVKITDIYGQDVDYTVENGTIKVDENNVFVYYNIVPAKLTIDGSFDSIVPERVYAYGVTREYYFSQTLYEDAKIWDSRFIASLENYARKKGETVMPGRRWV